MKKFLSVTIRLLLFLIAAVIVARFYVLPQKLYPQKFSDIVAKYSSQYGVDENMVYAIIKTESNFNQYAVSSKNAIGLMQITEATGEWAAAKMGINDFSKDKLFDPDINIEIGCWYIARLLKQFDSCDTAIAAYNAGSGNVSKWLENGSLSTDGTNLSAIPYSETENYVKKIKMTRQIYAYLYD